MGIFKHKEDTKKAVDQAKKAIDAGKLNASDITVDTLLASRLITKKLDGVRLLARGAITTAATISVNSASKAAVAAVEKAGGKVTLI